MVKRLLLFFEDKEHEQLKKKKKGRTWEKSILDNFGVKNRRNN